MSICDVYDPTIGVNIERNGIRMTVAFKDIRGGDVLMDYPGRTVSPRGAHLLKDQSEYEGYLFHDNYGNTYFPEHFGAKLLSGNTQNNKGGKA